MRNLKLKFNRIDKKLKSHIKNTDILIWLHGNNIDMLAVLPATK